MPPKAPQISMSAAMQAKISGVSRGTDVSVLVLAPVCLIGAVGCFWLSIWVPWALGGAAAFLLGFGFVLYVWRRGTAARTQTEAPPAEFTWRSGTQELMLSVPLDQDNYVVKKMLAGMRSLVQARELPPAPTGAVEGNPADAKALREYSAEERQSVQRKWAQEIPKHDELVVGQLDAAIESLESAPTERQTGTVMTDVKGLTQLPDMCSTKRVLEK
jgi:hypothetical protein